MRIEGIKTGLHDGFLLILTSQFMDGHCKTYVLADAKNGFVAAYGPYPCAAMEAMGRDGAHMTFMECVNRAVLAADDGYYIDNGHGIPMLEVSELWHMPDEISRFFSAETAALAAAVAGWPEPITLFRQNEKESA